MRTIKLKVSETDIKKYDLEDEQEVRLADLIEKINLEYANRKQIYTAAKRKTGRIRPFKRTKNLMLYL